MKILQPPMPRLGAVVAIALGLLATFARPAEAKSNVFMEHPLAAIGLIALIFLGLMGLAVQTYFECQKQYGDKP